MDDNARLHAAGAWPGPAAEDATNGASGLLGALPEGWVMLGRCRTGTAGPATFPTGCWALAHPTTGVALVDVAPDATPNAEARLRRALGAANFWSAFPGYLPVWHGRIELAAWRSLPGVMAEGFSELPPLTVPGKAAWIAASRAALADDLAWDVPGAAPRGARPIPPAMLEDDEDPPPAATGRPWRLRAALGIGFAATFLIGLASGVMLLPGDVAPPAPPPIVLAAVPVPPPMREAPAALPAAPLAATAAPPAAMAVPDAAAVPPPESAVPEPAVALAPPPPPIAPAEAATPVAHVALPLPPVAPRPPVKPARAPDRIDRACTNAVFRFQQGQRLTTAEEAYIRDGCATKR